MGEGRGNAFIVFLKRGRKEIAVEAGNSRVDRELRKKLYQKAKHEMRKSLEEDDRKAVFGKTDRRVDEGELEIELLATTPALYSTLFVN